MPATQNPFAKKPKLRHKRHVATVKLNIDGAADALSVEKEEDKSDEIVVPLGSDFKKISHEQIQAREKRLEKIKE